MNPLKKFTEKEDSFSVIFHIFFWKYLFHFFSISIAMIGQGSIGFYSVLPPLLTLVLAVATKQVFLSILCGYILGLIAYCVFAHTSAMEFFSLFYSLLAQVLEKNSKLIVFIMLMGGFVEIINKAGGSKSFARFVTKYIHSRRVSEIITYAIGIFLFMDDYFNSLTNGSVMKTVCQLNGVSPQKHAQIVHIIASNMCILIPITSWSAAVLGEITKAKIENPLSFLVQAIPYNFFSISVLCFVFFTVLFDIDIGPMVKHQRLAVQRAALQKRYMPFIDKQEASLPNKSNAFDLILPLLCLLFCSFFLMLVIGGIFDGRSFIEAMNNTNTIDAILYALFVTFCLLLLLYVPRHLLTFKEFVDTFIQGLKDMLSTLLVLLLAWSLGTMSTDLLGTGLYISSIIEQFSIPPLYIPCLIFLLAMLLTFSLGNAWGTFGLFLPIVFSILEKFDYYILLLGFSACLGGTLLGDHCSPISDTTIMTCTSTGCPIADHIKTQIPYMCIVAVLSLVSYIVAGLLRCEGWMILLVDIFLSFIIAVVFIVIQRVRTIVKERKSEHGAPNDVLAPLLISKSYTYLAKLEGTDMVIVVNDSNLTQDTSSIKRSYTFHDTSSPITTTL